MFKFVEGMTVVVNRAKPYKYGETTYSSSYPRVGWIGRLIRPSGRYEDEWEVEWTETYNGESLNRNGDFIRGWMIAPWYTNFDKIEINIKDKVIYTSGRFGDSESNPLWNGRFGKIYGIVTRINFIKIVQIKWEGQYRNKKFIPLDKKISENEYGIKDILPLSFLSKIPKKNIKRHIESLCDHLYSHRVRDRECREERPIREFDGARLRVRAPIISRDVLESIGASRSSRSSSDSGF